MVSGYFVFVLQLICIISGINHLDNTGQWFALYVLIDTCCGENTLILLGCQVSSEELPINRGINLFVKGCQLTEY